MRTTVMVGILLVAGPLSAQESENVRAVREANEKRWQNSHPGNSSDRKLPRSPEPNDGITHGEQISHLSVNDDEFNLICVGAGRANQMRTAYNYGQYSGSFSVTGQGGMAFGSTSGTTSGTSTWIESVPFDEQVNIIINREEARIRMPRAMLPIIRGGRNGWMKINDISITDQDITGSIGINFINNPRIRVDRVTGVISVNGKAGDFSGVCERHNPAQSRRRF